MKIKCLTEVKGKWPVGWNQDQVEATVSPPWVRNRKGAQRLSNQGMQYFSAVILRIRIHAKKSMINKI